MRHAEQGEVVLTGINYHIYHAFNDPVVDVGCIGSEQVVAFIDNCREPSSLIPFEIGTVKIFKYLKEKYITFNKIVFIG